MEQKILLFRCVFEILCQPHLDGLQEHIIFKSAHVVFIRLTPAIRLTIEKKNKAWNFIAYTLQHKHLSTIDTHVTSFTVERVPFEKCNEIHNLFVVVNARAIGSVPFRAAGLISSHLHEASDSTHDVRFLRKTIELNGGGGTNDLRLRLRRPGSNDNRL